MFGIVFKTAAYSLFLKDSGGPEKDLKMVYSSGPEKDRLKAWQMFYCGCCLASADCRGHGGWASGCRCSCYEAVVAGGEAAGASLSAGKNGCGVSICW